jgi:hypothetical protein
MPLDGQAKGSPYFIGSLKTGCLAPYPAAPVDPVALPPAEIVCKTEDFSLLVRDIKGLQTGDTFVAAPRRTVRIFAPRAAGTFGAHPACPGRVLAADTPIDDAARFHHVRYHHEDFF